jgi:hypothetical protein
MKRNQQFQSKPMMEKHYENNNTTTVALAFVMPMPSRSLNERDSALPP